jgi:hypothetical protein
MKTTAIQFLFRQSPALAALATLVCSGLQPAAASSNLPPLYLTVVSHNEEGGAGRPVYTADVNYYLQNRDLVKLLAETITSRGATYNFQSDWNYLKAVAQFDTGDAVTNTAGKNIVRWMKENLGVEVDPHAHETQYNYADVAYLIEQLGVTPSKNVGGFLYNPPDNPQGWEQHAAGLFGRVNTNYFWRADHLWGAATFQHQGDDDKSSGIWRPKDRYNFYVDDSVQRLLYIGGGCGGQAGVTNLLSQIETDLAPSNGFYTATLMMIQDFMTTQSIAQLGGFIDSLAPYVAQGRVRWVTLSQMAGLWRTQYLAQPFRYGCDGTTNLSPTTNFTVQTVETWVTAPNSNRLYTRLVQPVPALYPGWRFPALIAIPGGTGAGAPLADNLGYRGLASNGFVVACFNPEGRGSGAPGNLRSDGTENCNGFLHQDDLKAVIEHVARQPNVNTNNLGLQTSSFGIAIGAGCVGRYPVLPVAYLVDAEGPHDSRVITFYDAGREQAVCGHWSTVTDPSPANVAYWAEREAVRHIGGFRGRYLRMQAEVDHAQNPGYFRHALEMINTATKPMYGGAGSNRWTRINGSDLGNAVNVVYSLSNTSQYPAWISGRMADHSGLDVTYVKEMAALTEQNLQVTADGFATNGSFRLLVTGIGGESYVVQTSTNLLDWLALQTNKLASDTWLFADADAAGFNQRFYRALLAP